MSYVKPFERLKWRIGILYFLGKEKIISFASHVSFHVFSIFFKLSYFYYFLYLNPRHTHFSHIKLGWNGWKHIYQQQWLTQNMQVAINSNQKHWGNDQLFYWKKHYKIRYHCKSKQKQANGQQNITIFRLHLHANYPL